MPQSDLVCGEERGGRSNVRLPKTATWHGPSRAQPSPASLGCSPTANQHSRPEGCGAHASSIRAQSFHPLQETKTREMERQREREGKGREGSRTRIEQYLSEKCITALVLLCYHVILSFDRFISGMFYHVILQCQQCRLSITSTEFLRPPARHSSFTLSFNLLTVNVKCFVASCL